MRSLRHLLLATLGTCCCMLQAAGQTVPADTTTHLRRGVTERTCLWGAGWANVLDTYLTPLAYKGTNFAMLHRTERLARWGQGKVSVLGRYQLHLAYLTAPTDDGKEWDAELTAAGGWLYNFHPSRRWRLACGGVLEGSGGFTYNVRGGNNPAQGRLGTALCAAALAEWSFAMLRSDALLRLEALAPVAGVMFAPQYGQSYYEIFSLGHSDGCVHFTHPGNCPTASLLAQAELPLWGARLSLGYQADVRQHTLGGLKRHAWRHTLLIGYVRRLNLLRR